MKTLFIKYPHLLGYIPKFLKSKKFLRTIASENIKALEYVGKKLSENSAFLLSLNQSVYCDNEEFLIKALIKEKRKDLFIFASDRLKNDKNFLFHLLQLEDDRIGDIIVNNLHSWPALVDYYKIADLYLYASEELKEDRMFNLEFLIKLNQYDMNCQPVLKYLPEKFLLDLTFWQEYMTYPLKSFYFLNYLFLNHEAFKQNEVDMNKYSSDNKESYEKALNYLMTRKEKEQIEKMVEQVNSRDMKTKKI